MSETFLTHYSHSNFIQSTDLTPIQIQMDGLISSFVERASDGYALAGIFIGGGGGRLSRLGILHGGRAAAALAPKILGPFVKGSGWITGFAVESALFGVSPRILKVVYEKENLSSLNLYGEAGVIHDSIHSAAGLLGFKLAGIASAPLNPFARNLFQAGAIIASQQTLALLERVDRRREGFGEKFVEAEAMVLQLWAGMSMLYRFAPTLHQSEQKREIAIQAKGMENRQGPYRGPFSKTWALAGAGRGNSFLVKKGSNEILSINGGEGGGSRKKDVPFQRFEIPLEILIHPLNQERIFDPASMAEQGKILHAIDPALKGVAVQIRKAIVTQIVKGEMSLKEAERFAADLQAGRVRLKVTQEGAGYTISTVPESPRVKELRDINVISKILEKDETPECRITAALALGKLGDFKARPFLETALWRDTNPKVQEAAARALGILGDPRARYALGRVRSNLIYGPAIRIAASKALEKLTIRFRSGLFPNEPGRCGTIIEIGNTPVGEVIRVLEAYRKTRAVDGRVPEWKEIDDVRVALPADFPGRILDWGYEVYEKARKGYEADFRELLRLNQKIEEGEKLAEDEKKYLATLETQMKVDRDSFLQNRDRLESLALLGGVKEEQSIRLFHNLTHRRQVWDNPRYVISKLLRDIPLNTLNKSFLERGEGVFSINEIFDEGISLALNEIPSRFLGTLGFNQEDHTFLQSFQIRQGVHATRRLGDIFANLLTNAWRYRTSDQPEVKRSPKLLADGSLQITLSDNGIGILPENLAKLGQPGFREGRKEVKDSHGYGISSIIADLSTLSWGRLWVKSKPGEGTQFRFTIPASAIQKVESKLKDPKYAEFFDTSTETVEERNAKEGFIALSMGQ
jgi:signal transduction histidine kinase